MVLLLREKLARGPVNGVIIVTNAPACVEILGYAGLDYVIIDTEHGANDIAEVEHMVRAAEIGGLTPLVRVTKNDPKIILRAMDVGAQGVLVPQVNSAAEAREAVLAVKYAPEGERGLAGIVRAARYGFKPLKEYIAEANARTTVFVQVEDARSVADLDEILAVEGLDGVLVGPGDLSQSMGMTGQFDHPDFVRTVHDVMARTIKAGKVAGMFCFNAEQARYWRSQGVRLLLIGTDTTLFSQAARALAKDLKAD